MGLESSLQRVITRCLEAIATYLLSQDTHLSESALQATTQQCFCEVLVWVGQSRGMGAEWVEAPHLISVARQHTSTLSLAIQSAIDSLVAIPVESLGLVYEYCLSQVVCLGPERTLIICNQAALKKRSGVYYTPVAVIDYMVENTVGRLLADKNPIHLNPGSLRILDPACGTGAFLVGAYQYLLNWYRDGYITAGLTGQNHPSLLQLDAQGHWQLTLAEQQRILQAHIYGVDLDPQAVAIAKLILWLKMLGPDQLLSKIKNDCTDLSVLDCNIQCGNAIIGPDYHHPSASPLDWQAAFPQVWQSGGFDAVIGNPPYIDSEWMQAHQPGWRRYCVSHYQTAAGNWDLFCIFIEKALQLCKPGGLTSLIVPNKLAAADYAAKARSLLTQDNQLIAIRDYSQIPLFAIAVYPLVYLARKQLPELGATVDYEQMHLTKTGEIQCGRSQQLAYALHFTNPEQPWPLGGSLPQSHLVQRLRQKFPALATTAQVMGAATVKEAYTIQPLLSEGPDTHPETLQVVNSGIIDPYCLLWGTKPCRYLGDIYLYPVIPAVRVHQLPSKRYQQATQPKIIIAGMTKGLECAVDLQGQVLAGKSTSIVFSTVDLRYLLGLLNSKLLTFYFQKVFGGNCLQGGYLRVGPPQLRTLPIRLLDLSHSHQQAQHQQMVQLVTQRLALSQQWAIASRAEQTTIQPTIQETDQQINHLVYELYHLSEAEIHLVESSPERDGSL